MSRLHEVGWWAEELSEEEYLFWLEGVQRDTAELVEPNPAEQGPEDNTDPICDSDLPF